MKSSELLRILLKAGWYIVRQNGSHMTLRHPTNPEQITFPSHGSAEVGKGLAAKILKQAGLR
ncbi:type II toxin-antitoxin system HicA family toxin [Hymenobacter cheonanensis]|uniref:type II toxin-antitoxin system HicA family toxin n=1 Tax=Hymenobacter sp. CA2-7 TaxID=3063993 RepID=UPI002712B97A|nr:type II toxin-antitoxin system HicA family toxin [Hymenobacter sp. CA2-7]MDO7888192.1 type II toxin-antitoxin system HicA family toxin [Hymenobacter sp. CA2-7]